MDLHLRVCSNYQQKMQKVHSENKMKKRCWGKWSNRTQILLSTFSGRLIQWFCRGLPPLREKICVYFLTLLFRNDSLFSWNSLHHSLQYYDDKLRDHDLHFDEKFEDVSAVGRKQDQVDFLRKVKQFVLYCYLTFMSFLLHIFSLQQRWKARKE